MAMGESPKQLATNAPDAPQGTRGCCKVAASDTVRESTARSTFCSSYFSPRAFSAMTMPTEGAPVKKLTMLQLKNVAKTNQNRERIQGETCSIRMERTFVRDRVLPRHMEQISMVILLLMLTKPPRLQMASTTALPVLMLTPLYSIVATCEAGSCCITIACTAATAVLRLIT